MMYAFSKYVTLVVLWILIWSCTKESYVFNHCFISFIKL